MRRNHNEVAEYSLSATRHFGSDGQVTAKSERNRQLVATIKTSISIPKTLCNQAETLAQHLPEIIYSELPLRISSGITKAKRYLMKFTGPIKISPIRTNNPVRLSKVRNKQCKSVKGDWPSIKVMYTGYS
jgi:hypothetical protein